MVKVTFWDFQDWPYSFCLVLLEYSLLKLKAAMCEVQLSCCKDHMERLCGLHGEREKA